MTRRIIPTPMPRDYPNTFLAASEAQNRKPGQRLFSRPCTHKSRLVSSGWSVSALPPKVDIRQRIAPLRTCSTITICNHSANICLKILSRIGWATGFAWAGSLERGDGQLLRRLSRAAYTLNDLFFAGDKGGWRGTWNATQRKEWEGIPATGRKAKWTVIIIGRFEGETLTEDWVEYDRYNLFRRLGAL